ncbi:hypothetical protein NC651_007088 [Populus alba x Populus x berolinensis]|nr:hypothetical protein NC651_007088 [Populus alba x Populus x berolinensis]
MEPHINDLNLRPLYFKMKTQAFLFSSFLLNHL